MSPVSDLTIVFAGSPAAAVPSLTALQASRHTIAAVVTREDSEQGRRKVLTPTAVAMAADELALPTIKANRLAGAATDQIVAAEPDLGVIVAYGGLVREPLLSAPRLGWINLHFSLLPRWRGAAPVQRSLMAGDEITGASVFQLVEALDAGQVFGQLTQFVDKEETAGELLDSLSIGGAELLLRVVDSIADGTARSTEQEGDVTLAPKLGIEDGRIRWSEHGSTVTNLIRGVTPEPGAFTTIDGARLKVLRATRTDGIPPVAPGRLELIDGRVVAGTGTTPVELVIVHPAGKKAMSAVDWWRGRPAGAGVVAE
jgi:methionyl-tRNA formyltransferase